MQIRHPLPFSAGYDAIVDRGGPNADLLMDFGALSLGPGEAWSSGKADEKALLLVSGQVDLGWPGGRASASRASLFDEPPSVLHLPAGEEASLRAGPEGAIFYLIRTINSVSFPSR
ncbi:MAG: 5-deoxy-glucuronate isomerase, partial [Spirochaetota bacterium]